MKGQVQYYEACKLRGESVQIKGWWYTQTTQGRIRGHRIGYSIYRCKRYLEGHLDALGLFAAHSGDHHRTG